MDIRWPSLSSRWRLNFNLDITLSNMMIRYLKLSTMFVPFLVSSYFRDNILHVPLYLNHLFSLFTISLICPYIYTRHHVTNHTTSEKKTRYRYRSQPIIPENETISHADRERSRPITINSKEISRRIVSQHTPSSLVANDRSGRGGVGMNKRRRNTGSTMILMTENAIVSLENGTERQQSSRFEWNN